MLDTAEMRYYALLGVGMLIFALGMYYGLPVEQILAILAAFGVGGILPSPVK